MAEALVPLRDVAGMQLNWRRAGLFKATYELLARERVVARLRRERFRRYRAELADGSYLLTHRGLPTKTIIISGADAGDVIANVSLSGWLFRRTDVYELPSGMRYELRHARPFRFVLTAFDPRGSELFTMRLSDWPFRRTGSTQVTGAGWSAPQLGPLLLAAYATLLLRRRRTAGRAGG